MKRLYRTIHDRKLAGVCGGLGHYFNIDPTMVRILAIILFFASGGVGFIIGYIIAVFVIPNETEV
ncbi:PspC domain-containing protein [Evansella sp. AB-P1]|uniref:PspC domain-containing protein n=1 Tax=Evansella sp. AB-P1 TaxID=3037653 RepID=UPI00241E8425|nr:PspC domain-containing protein [Evansella sp. AB-P1]MDG5786624.1 PspC domain-containing protein [Evansella sp. AB-P1]